MNEIKTITLFVSEEEAKKFIEYQKNFLMFNLLLEKGVFNIKNGSAVLNFDNEGVLQNIQRADFLYSRKHESY